jgi:hypothetical protein
MSNSNNVLPAATSVALGSITSVALGGSGVGLAVMGTGVGIPAAVAVATVSAVGWVLGSIFNLFRPRPKHKVINVTAVAVDDDNDDDELLALPCVTPLMVAYDMELGLLAQGIF